MVEQSGVCVLGIFVADTAYLAERMPAIGETLIGSGFSVGPGGKGSNQAVAAAKAGAGTRFITKIGDDTFGKMALATYDNAGVTPALEVMSREPTGAAFIFIDEKTGDNAIIVYPGAAGTITTNFVDGKASVIRSSRVFVTQLEQPAESALKALEIARGAGVITVFNPAPAESFPMAMLALCDYVVPNETEASALVGFAVNNVDTARQAAGVLRNMGAGAALITLGEQGVYVQSEAHDVHIASVSSDTVIDTSGAGDAFVGGFCTAISEDKDLIAAVRFGCATAGIAVTRRGTGPAMPSREEIDALVQKSMGSVWS